MLGETGIRLPASAVRANCKLREEIEVTEGGMDGQTTCRSLFHVLVFPKWSLP